MIPNLVVYGVDPYSKILAGDFQQANMIATLTMLFGVLGLVLAAVGLYGVMAYSVEQRTSEIGVRMALGADRASVVRMVLRGAFFQIGIGLGLGIPLAIGAGQLMTSQLFGVSPWDPRMLTIATLRSAPPPCWHPGFQPPARPLSSLWLRYAPSSNRALSKAER